MAKAFILHRRAQDTSALDPKVSEIVAVVDGKIFPFDPGGLFSTVDANLSHFDPGVDFIVPSGSTLVNFLSGFYLGMKSPRRIRLMVHDVKNNRYRESVFCPILKVK